MKSVAAWRLATWACAAVALAGGVGAFRFTSVALIAAAFAAAVVGLACDVRAQEEAGR